MQRDCFGPAVPAVVATFFVSLLCASSSQSYSYCLSACTSMGVKTLKQSGQQRARCKTDVSVSEITIQHHMHTFVCVRVFFCVCACVCMRARANDSIVFLICRRLAVTVVSVLVCRNKILTFQKHQFVLLAVLVRAPIHGQCPKSHYCYHVCTAKQSAVDKQTKRSEKRTKIIKQYIIAKQPTWPGLMC